MKLNSIKVLFVLIVFLNITPNTFSQDLGKDNIDVSGAATITTQGISIVPALSLGKPAAIFNLSVGKRLSFEPDFRFSLEGKPWSFLFWFRYDLLDTDKFKLRVGAHPAINFKAEPATVNKATRELIEARRFVAGELNSSYYIDNNVSVGIYYLHGHGFDPNTPANTDYVGFKSSISDDHLFQDFTLTLNPQLYFLKIGEAGYYFTSTVSLSKNDIPFSVSAFYNQAIQSDISGTEEILWNVSLTYSFSF